MYKSSIINELNEFKCDQDLSKISSLYTQIASSYLYLCQLIFDHRQVCFERQISIKLVRTPGNILYTLDPKYSVLGLGKTCFKHQSQFIVYPIVTQFSDHPASHFTFLILNRDRNEFEHFDPNGLTPWLSQVEAQLERWIKELIPTPSTYTFNRTLTFCPLKGPQQISQKGWCVAFSLVYLLVRLTEPHLSRDEIVTDILNSVSTEVMSNFICFLFDLYELKHINEFEMVRLQIKIHKDTILNLFNQVLNLGGSSTRTTVTSSMKDVAVVLSNLSDVRTVQDLKYRLLVLSTVESTLKRLIRHVQVTQLPSKRKIHFIVGVLSAISKFIKRSM